jgi:anti-sigma factor RsiW
MTHTSGPECPDFEVLSRFVDGELTGADGTDAESHLAACEPCARLANRLAGGLGVGDARRDGGIGGSGCADEETLVLYSSGTLAAAQRAGLDQHLGECDRCMAAVVAVHRRLRLADRIAVAVPPSLIGRAAAAFESSQRDRPLAARTASWLESVRRRCAELVRMPVLVPTALAAAALLIVALQLNPDNNARYEASRAVDVGSTLRITVPLATVRSRPSHNADVVAKLERGTTVAVAGEERGWYRIVLPNDRSGWLEREAFE